MNFLKKNLGWTLLAIFFILTILLSIKSNNNGEINYQKEMTSSGINRDLLTYNTGLVDDLSELSKSIENKKEEKDYINTKIINKDLVESKSTYFRVSVNSLKLNNIYFNKTLAYLSQGDKLKQITNKNSRGCFKIKVVGAINKINLGKIGYVCDKYVRNDLNNGFIKNNKQQLKNEIIYKNNKIKPLLIKKDIFYKININSLKLNNIYFNKVLAYLGNGDILRQITNKNSKGCFKVRIIISNNKNNLGKQGYVCEKYLKKVELESTWLAF